MKILCISDQIDPLVYSINAKKRFHDIDVVLCAGDLPMEYIDFVVTTFNKPTYFVFGNHNLKEFRYYNKATAVQQYASMSAQINQELLKHIHGGINIGFKIIINKNLKWINPKTGKNTPLIIAGLPGSREYNHGLNQYTDFQMKFKILCLMPHLLYNKIRYGRYVDILLTHATPRHIHDKEDPCHKGFESFNWFINKFKPFFLVHGHIHLYDLNTPRITEVGKTTVINAFSYFILNFPKTNNQGNRNEQ